MGEVYKARDTQLERTVAVKILPTPLFTVALPQNANDIRFGGREYAVTKDGRFLVNVLQQQSAAIPLTVVVNWLAASQK